MEKFRLVCFGFVIVSSVLTAFFNILGGGNVAFSLFYFLLASIFGFIWVIIVLGEKDSEQQTQIDDLKRELEEMKERLK
jgi:hypothetical protein